jgi:formylglycine-generating enzyme required for sulfatase activity
MTLTIGAVVVLGLGVIALSLLPSSKQSAPTNPTAKGDQPKESGTKDAPPERKDKPPGLGGVGLPKAAEPHETDSKPVEPREAEIAEGIKMKFCWVPAGMDKLGSPKAEREAVLASLKDPMEPEWLQAEAEEERGKFTTKGFWLGKYEVTQHQWRVVMRDTPHADAITFRIGGRNAGGNRLAGVTDTSNFAADYIPYYQCQMFLQRANSHGGVKRAFGSSARLVLPSEDEWEYACRGGRGNEQPFIFGKEWSEKEANCHDLLHRTTKVGDYETNARHPWGLCDMHGNVWEWCETKYKTTTNHVLRGGSWSSPPYQCRAAYRGLHARSDAYTDQYGFRVLVRID